VNGEPEYLHGAFIVIDPGPAKARRPIPFRFNPEGLSRSLSVEAGQPGGGVEGAAPGAAARPAAEASADTGGSVKETFSVLIRLDFADLPAPASVDEAKLGIAPEIAAIEDLLYPLETDPHKASDGTEPKQPALSRPTVLFVWGRNRVLPVRIASLKIDESVYNAELNPVRAEIEASLEVLGEAEARADETVRAALNHTNKARRQLAGEYHNKKPAQTTKYVDPLEGAKVSEPVP
jgi:hypothetical protein